MTVAKHFFGFAFSAFVFYKGILHQVKTHAVSAVQRPSAAQGLRRMSGSLFLRTKSRHS